jgi:uncharacterized membrane protein
MTAPSSQPGITQQLVPSNVTQSEFVTAMVHLYRGEEWPRFHMRLWKAAGLRLRRTYQWIFAILPGSWVIVLMTHPTATASVTEIMDRASVGSLPGPLVVAAIAVLYGSLAALGIYSSWASRAKANLPAGHPGRMGGLQLE